MAKPAPSLSDVTITSPDRYRTICSLCRRESDRAPGQRCEQQYNTSRCNGILKDIKPAPKKEKTL